MPEDFGKYESITTKENTEKPIEITILKFMNQYQNWVKVWEPKVVLTQYKGLLWFVVICGHYYLLPLKIFLTMVKKQRKQKRIFLHYKWKLYWNICGWETLDNAIVDRLFLYYSSSNELVD